MFCQWFQLSDLKLSDVGVSLEVIIEVVSNASLKDL